MKEMLRGFVEDEIEEALQGMHTAFLAKVACVKGVRTDLQPLAMVRMETGVVAALPLVAGAPKLKGVTVKEGDVCLCVVCEREMGAALHGEMTLPELGHHILANCVIVGVVEA